MNHPRALTPGQRADLLAIARHAICERARGRPATPPSPPDPILRALGAAFVTVTRAGALRGCIGYVHAVRPLAETVAHCAASATTEDPRFPPVTPDELPLLQIEISILSPLVRITDPAEVRVGLHGLQIAQRGQHGLLLPQVATEYGWDRATFLSQACFKAGLPGDAWRHGAEMHIFTVDHFSDGLPIEAPRR